ncbi:hypothetical protein D3C71_1808220 [compost metagenome]
MVPLAHLPFRKRRWMPLNWLPSPFNPGTWKKRAYRATISHPEQSQEIIWPMAQSMRSICPSARYRVPETGRCCSSLE